MPAFIGAHSMHHSTNKYSMCIISVNLLQSPVTQLLLLLSTPSSPHKSQENWSTKRLNNWLKVTKQVNAERLKNWPMALLNHALTPEAAWKKEQALVPDTAQPHYVGELGDLISSWRVGVNDLSSVQRRSKIEISQVCWIIMNLSLATSQEPVLDSRAYC